ncbi:hypothetical protein ACQFX9_18560 [Aliinostoc sp. HNIBRCY26]|uniref:hypothetical protein n=1 Tax=Aliinostoc sp. HNIBRCY26 TaxID=3418997 RepID=UPI003CFE1724
MIALFLGVISLVIACTGAFLGARTIADIDMTNEKFTSCQYLHDKSFKELDVDLKFTKSSVQEYSQICKDTISNTENIFKFIDENITNNKQLVMSSEISIQQIQQCKDTFDEIKQYIVDDANSVDTLKKCYGATHLANPLKLEFKDLLDQNISLKQADKTTSNHLRKYSMMVLTGSMIILCLLTFANITVSPAVLITSVILNRLQNKAFRQVSEYESDVKNVITKIDAVKDLMIQIRQEIDESVDSLKSLNDSINDFKSTVQISNTTNQVTNAADFAVKYLPGVDPGFKKGVHLIKTFLDNFMLKILDYEAKLKSLTLNLKEKDARRLLLGLDGIININFDQKLVSFMI